MTTRVQADKAVTGLQPVANGGTGASDAATARSNLGAMGSTDTISKATNLAGGVAGSIPYQSAAGTTAYSGVGTAGQVLISGGAGAPSFGSIASGFSNFAVFTSSGTWTVPAGVTKVKVTVVGGGGGGGHLVGPSCGTYYWGGAGGGAGGAAIKIVSGLTPGATVSVTVGVGAPGGTNTGGTSSFGAHCSATGGGGGQYGYYPGVGGVGASGDINISGAPGTVGTFASNAASAAGTGGSSILGGGGRISAVKAAQGFGGGGAGGDYTFNNAGGAGFAGVVIIEY